MQLLLLMTTRRLLQLFLLISAVATTSAAAALYPPGHDPWPDDERALVAFKAKISGHSGVLDSWNQSTSYCSWVGVTCGRRHRWRVVALNLSSQGLAGTISPAIGNLTFLRLLNLSYNTTAFTVRSLPASAPSGAFNAFTWSKTRSLVSSQVTSAAASASVRSASNTTKACREAYQPRLATCHRSQFYSCQTTASPELSRLLLRTFPG